METIESVQALVVRNIGDIEGALAHARKIGLDIWDAVQSALRDRLAPLGWHVAEFHEAKGNIWFAPPEWMTPDVDKPEADRWFAIECTLGLDGEVDETSLADFLQAGPQGSGIALFCSSDKFEKKTFRKRVIGQSGLELAALKAAGFEIDSENYLRIPIRLEVEAVAKGAEDEDYADALKPLHDAIDIAVANVAHFVTLLRAGETA